LKKTVVIPYGRKDHISVDIPEENSIGIFRPRDGKPIIDEEQAIQKALDKPIGVSSLKELVRGKKSAAIAITDASRPNIEKKNITINNSKFRIRWFSKERYKDNYRDWFSSSSI